MSAVAIPILLMLTLVLGEMIILNREARGSVDWHDVAFNLNSGHLMLWLFRGLEIAVYGFVAASLSLGVMDHLPRWGIWAFAFIAWDFCFYWLHRLHHEYRLLWAVHVVHHEGEHFNLSLAIRNSWYSSLASIPFFLPLALLGVPVDVFITVSILHYAIQMMNHSALTPHLGFLEHVLVTPAHHRVHHVADRAWSDSNYAGSLVIWDKLFGTYRADLPEGDFAYGVKDAQPVFNPALASNLPILRHVLRKRVAAPSAPRYRIDGRMVLAGTLLLFGLVTGYIWRYGYGAPNGEQALLFALLAFGAVALGALSDGRIWALRAWPLITLALGLQAWTSHAGNAWLATCAGLILHGVALALGLARRDPA